jgi:hypothetical protein
VSIISSPAFCWLCSHLCRATLILTASFCALAVTSAPAAELPPGAIVLFDGNDTAQWVRSSGGAARWNITNNLLTVVPGSGNIRTFQTFDDLQLHLEFRFLTNSPAGTPEGNLANSGVFLQDQFEIQIMESYNRTFGGMNDSGAIYSLRDATTNASVPNGSWESYDIAFRAARWSGGLKRENARVTVVWNGVLVHDDVEIIRPTASGAPPETAPPGSIMLQDLVAGVQFRNIWVVPLTQPRPPGPESITLVPARADWRYLDDGSDAGTAWRQPGFDDSGWNRGLAQFGYGDGDERTLLRSNRLDGTRIQTTYFRKPFLVANAWAVTNLAVGLLRDDGGIVYLNSEEIFRSNVANGTVNYTNWALTAVGNADETIYLTTNVPPPLLVNGTNWLAVEIHQQSATSTDVSFDLRLTALAYRAPPLAVTRATGQIELCWPADPPGFTLQSSTQLAPGASWIPGPSAAAPTNGFLKAAVNTDSGARYYRLIRN